MPAAPDRIGDLIAARRRSIYVARLARAAILGAFAAAAGCVVSLLASLFFDVELPTRAILVILSLAPLIVIAAPMPETLTIAQAIDHRLTLHELLSSALTLHGRDDQAATAVRAAAEARAASIPADAVKVPLPSARLVLTAMLTLVLSLVVSIVAARERAGSAVVSNDGKRPVRSTASNAGSDHAELARPAIDVLEQARAEKSPTRSDMPSLGERGSGVAADDAAPDSLTPEGDAGGAGTSSTHDPASLPAFPAGAEPPRTIAIGDPATGSGSSEAGNTIRGARSASSAALARAALNASPATIEGTAREAARVALDGRRVPDGSRDLVRAYFDLDQPRSRAADAQTAGAGR